jgi:hypothetical protein
LGKKLVVVANDSLMDNHQMELANAMQAAGVVLPQPQISPFRPSHRADPVPAPPFAALEH